MVRVSWVVLALTLLLPASLPADTAADADAALQEAIETYNEGGEETAILLMEKALSLYIKSGNLSGRINVLNQLGLIEYYRAAYAPAEARFQEALDIARQGGA